MAEGIMKDLLLDEYDKIQHVMPIEIISAGTFAANGNPASRFAIEVAAQHGINLNFHQSREITENLVKKADLILTMARGHREALLAQWPDAASRTEVLRLDGKDVADPIGESVAEYQRCAEQIRKELATRIEGITLNK